MGTLGYVPFHFYLAFHSVPVPTSRQPTYTIMRTLSLVNNLGRKPPINYATLSIR